MSELPLDTNEEKTNTEDKANHKIAERCFVINLLTVITDIALVAFIGKVQFNDDAIFFLKYFLGFSFILLLIVTPVGLSHSIKLVRSGYKTKLKIPSIIFQGVLAIFLSFVLLFAALIILLR